jgi:hypothetical protein
MIIDEELPYTEFFSDSGIDLFTIFFKLTFYEEDTDYSVLNNTEQSLEIENHSSLSWAITGKVRKLESQINYVINNLLLKQLEATKDKFTLLIYTAELMHSQEVKSTKRIAKVLQVYSKMYSSIKEASESANERHKFFMGALF